LQELKCIETELPWKEVEQRGYLMAAIGQKAYNGVAIVSRQPISDVATNPFWPDDPQARAIVGTVAGVRIINLYVVNGQEVGSEKYAYKLEWLTKLHTWLAGLPAAPTVICGDYNIAPADLDVHDPAEWVGKILCSEPERSAFNGILSLGYADAFRVVYPTKKQFTWWDYRTSGFERGAGMRIDHHLITPHLQRRLLDVTVDMEGRGNAQASDHAAVTLHLAD
jgi:exodeoxyribonuclease-3